MLAMSEIVPRLPELRLGNPNAAYTETIPSALGTPISQLIGPCYLHGIMNGELYMKKRYERMLEWETDRAGTILKPTICLV